MSDTSGPNMIVVCSRLINNTRKCVNGTIQVWSICSLRTVCLCLCEYNNVMYIRERVICVCELFVRVFYHLPTPRGAQCRVFTYWLIIAIK